MTQLVKHLPSTQVMTPESWDGAPHWALCSAREPASPSPSAPPQLILSVSMNLTVLGTSYKWNHIVFGLLCLVYFTQHVFRISFHFRDGFYSIVSIYHLFFNHSPTEGHSGCSHHLATRNVGVQISVQALALSSFG